MASRSRVISCVLLLGILAAILVAWNTRKTSEQQAMESLVEFVVRNGRIGMVTPEGLRALPAAD